jgi:hypothetical protein
MHSISHWWKLRKLQKLRRKTRQEYARKAEEYRSDKTKTSEDMQALSADEYFESKMIDEAVDLFLSDRLLDQATDYDVEIPHAEDFWAYTDDGTRRYLKAKARADLRELIHQAKARSFEEWARWIPVVMALAGLIGVITGLVAVFKK